MSFKVDVRSARAEDESAIGNLGALLVTEHHEFDPQRFIAPLPNLAKRYGEFLVSQSQRPDMRVLVAEQNFRVAGYAYAGMEGADFKALRGPAGVIYDLVVDPAQRRQGIGMALLEEAIKSLEALGAHRVLLFTAEKNRLAQAMFDRAGFRRTMIEMTREIGPD